MEALPGCRRASALNSREAGAGSREPDSLDAEQGPLRRLSPLLPNPCDLPKCVLYAYSRHSVNICRMNESRQNHPHREEFH